VKSISSTGVVTLKEDHGFGALTSVLANAVIYFGSDTSKPYYVCTTPLANTFTFAASDLNCANERLIAIPGGATTISPRVQVMVPANTVTQPIITGVAPTIAYSEHACDAVSAGSTSTNDKYPLFSSYDVPVSQSKAADAFCPVDFVVLPNDGGVSLAAYVAAAGANTLTEVSRTFSSVTYRPSCFTQVQDEPRCSSPYGHDDGRRRLVLCRVRHGRVVLRPVLAVVPVDPLRPGLHADL